MARPDETITYLKDRGYCVLRIPRSDARPLQTLRRVSKRDLTRLGELGNITITGANPLPPVSVDNVGPSGISGKESSTTKLEVGINILGNILKALGDKPLGATTGFENAKTLTFTFGEVLEDHVDVDRLDQFLTTCTFRPDMTTVTDALIDDEVYVITSTIKTAKFTVSAKGDGGVKVGLDVPVISGVAGGSLKVDVGRVTEGAVTYEGTKPVAFGFQAVRLFFDEVGGRLSFSAMDPLNAGAAAARAAGRITPTLLKLDDGVFFQLAT